MRALLTRRMFSSQEQTRGRPGAVPQSRDVRPRQRQTPGKVGTPIVLPSPSSDRWCSFPRLSLTRIIEIEWAVKNNRPFKVSPKKRRSTTHSKSKSRRSRRKATPDPDGDGDGSGKENVGVAGDAAEASSSGKRRVENAEAGTPPRKRRLVKFEEE